MCKGMELVDKLEKYVERYRTFDEPVPYKGIGIYPIITKDYFQFIESVDILKIEKNKIPDISIIQMSYLSFLLHLIIENEDFLNKFIALCNLCLHVNSSSDLLNKNFPKGQVLLGRSNGDEIYFINGYDIQFINSGNSTWVSINGERLSSIEFDEVIEIIFFQNFPNYDNEEMSDDFKNMMEEYYRLKNKNIKPPTLEEQLVAIMSQNGMSKAEIKQESIYTIKSMIDSIVSKTDYEIQHLYRSHAMTDKKLPDIEHWLIKSNKDKYSEMFSDLDEYKKNFKI